MGDKRLTWDLAPKVDVLEEIKDLLIFESDDDFYYLQILQRKKDCPEIGSKSRVVKSYYIKSLKHLEDKYTEIKNLCTIFNARASLRLNKRSFEKVAFKSIVNVANAISNKKYKFIVKSYDRACGDGHNDKNKKWIVDVDEDQLVFLEEIIGCIELCEPQGNKILKKLRTKSGIHLITTPFNVKQFQDKLPSDILPPDLHKDNPINLFIP